MDTELFLNFLKHLQMKQNVIFILKIFMEQNNHHIIESCFKAFAKSYRIAVEIDKRRKIKYHHQKALFNF